MLMCSLFVNDSWNFECFSCRQQQKKNIRFIPVDSKYGPMNIDDKNMKNKECCFTHRYDHHHHHHHQHDNDNPNRETERERKKMTMFY